MLELINISKSFSKKIVLKDINLKVNHGEIISLLGPSGSGKTTILNVILGLVKPDEGMIVFDGEELNNVEMKDRGFNVVFQDYALFPNLSAFGNIVYSLRNKKKLMTQDEVEHIVDFCDLNEHLDKRIYQLSGGQKQRVALARTLVSRPRVLLLDEPFSALDGMIKEEIKDKVRDIAKEFNLTTIIVTHDPEEALTMSDRVLIINDGEIACYDEPKKIIAKPESDFVNDFIVKQLMAKRDNIFALIGECHA